MRLELKIIAATVLSVGSGGREGDDEVGEIGVGDSEVEISFEGEGLQSTISREGERESFSEYEMNAVTHNNQREQRTKGMERTRIPRLLQTDSLDVQLRSR